MKSLLALMLMWYCQTAIAQDESASSTNQTGLTESIATQTTSANTTSTKTTPTGSNSEPEQVVEEIFHNYFDRQAEAIAAYSRYGESTSWLPGDGDQFGLWSFNWYSEPGEESTTGFISRHSMHLLGGPVATPLPPRLYDFVWGFQSRERIGDYFSYDLAAHVGIFSDFEDSARQGVRFPGHAVGFLKTTPNFEFAVGVDYLGRDDIKVLPVFGFRYVGPVVEMDMIFPRPQVSVHLSANHKLYIMGELGGGTWDIERPDETNDVVTYSDYRIAIGWENIDEEDGMISTLEIGIAFERELEFRDSPFQQQFDNSFFIRWADRF